MKKHFFTVAVLMYGAFVFAHPHVAITSSVNFVWEGKSLQGAYIEWTFDRFFSADIINWLDADRDGTFNKAENEQVYNNAFINLRNYYYYTFIRQGKKRTNPEKVTQFKATQNKGIMTYRFYIDLSSYAGNELYVAVYDYTYFCDIRYAEDRGVLLTYDRSQINPSFTIIENRDYPVFYDPLGPITDTSVYYEWKPGLQTYYPREIRISW
ncbi:DUF1007 family protein [Treponema sp. OMZ 840]|uniref:DUF1007 family protein n=1 Tax=Treponema sp. OMZ 840 TaxID=244313 RepID=UPI003D941C15